MLREMRKRVLRCELRGRAYRVAEPLAPLLPHAPLCEHRLAWCVGAPWRSVCVKCGAEVNFEARAERRRI